MEPLKTGAIIAGKFRLDRPLAKGGMGSVWVARHLQLDLNVALKFMSADVAKSASGRARFEREAKAAAHLQSPHIVSVLDYGMDGEIPYMALELLKGEDLETRLRRDKRLPLPELLTLLTQAAKGLRRAHEAGIVHRDLKPRNMFLVHGPDDEDLLLKILDFGIAKEMNKVLVDDSTNTGVVIGSPNYMSPEQIRALKDIDYRTDLWSLGVIVFQAATGRLPFSGEAVGEVFAKILVDPLPVATSLCPDLPPSIDDFFERALARNPLNRFPSAREMATAFAEVVDPAMPARDSRWSQPEGAPKRRPSSGTVVVTEVPGTETTTQVKQPAPANSPSLPMPGSPTVKLDAEEVEVTTTGGTLSNPAVTDATTVDFRPSRFKRALKLGLALAAAVGALLVLRPRWLIAWFNETSELSPAQSTGVVTSEKTDSAITPPQVPPTTMTAAPNDVPKESEPAHVMPAATDPTTNPEAPARSQVPAGAAKIPPQASDRTYPAAEYPQPAPPPTAATSANQVTPATPTTAATPAQVSPPAPTEAPKPPPAPTDDPMKLGF